MINVKLLGDICRVPGACGYEQRIREFIINELSSLVDEIKIDSMGNVLATKKGEHDKTVMIPAHMDEISFVVSHIDDDGFVRFHTLGGFDPKTLTAQRVIIHGEKKDIIGVMGSKPIHIMDASERNKAPKTKEYFIDTGMKVEDVKRYIEIGNPITRERELIEMGETVNSKSIDNRVSVFILIETLRALKDKKVPYDIVAAFTVQEEVGLRGALVAASGVNPDYCINLDVTIAYDMPGSSPHESVTRLGDGTAIKILDGRSICDYRMVNFMKKVAKENNIKHQLEVLPMGGTDTAAVQQHSNGGSVAGGISIPCRYLHQVIEMVHKEDIENSIELLKHCLLDINKFDWSFK